jgi:hypothetical protein
MQIDLSLLLDRSGMTKIQLTIVGLLLMLSCLSAQAQRNKDHKGFYFSFGGGPVKGNINGYDTNGNMSLISGTGTELNFQIGSAVWNKLIVHAVLDSKLLSGPTINNSKVTSNFSLNETVFGGGLTKYTRGNFFVTGNAGTGSFSFSDQKHKVSTKNGFAFLVKAGKEWWISRKFGIGLALTYNQTKLTNPTATGISEKWNSNRYGILVQATFN